MYGADWCVDCRRSKAVFDADGVDFEYVDIAESAEATEEARSISGSARIPVIVFPDGTHLVEPSDAELRERIARLGA